MECRKPHSIGGVVCALESYRFYGEPSFAGTAISNCRCLLWPPRLGRNKSLWT